MATLRNKRNLAAVLRKTPENTRNRHSQDTIDPELAHEDISQVSEEIAERVSKKLSEEFSTTESRVLGALYKLDELLLNPQVRTCSVAGPGTSRNNGSENREPTGDRSVDDPCPEAMPFLHHSGNLNGSVLGETNHMTTGVIEEIRNRHHMVKGTKKEIPYCSPGTSSGKLKKAPSTSQPQFLSENTTATIEADLILLALQRVATNSHSANFNSNINRTSKVPKSLTTTMPTFDGNSEKFELFEDLCQTILKNHNQLTKEDKIN